MNKIKNVILNLYANVLLRNKEVVNNRVTIIITETHRDNSLAMLDYLLNDLPEPLDIYLIVDLSIIGKISETYHERDNVHVVSMKKQFSTAVGAMVTSKYVFFMHRKPYHIIKKRKNQVVVNLWHGFGYKAAGVNDNEWRDGKDFDVVLVPGPAYIESASRFFKCDSSRVLPIGYPRYDFFFRENLPEQDYVRQLVGNEFTGKIIIWMPTFRKTEKKELLGGESEIAYSFDLPLLKNNTELNCLNDLCCGKNVVIIIKRHPYQVKYQCENTKYSNIFFISNEDLENHNASLYPFLTKTDAMISDYSSVAIDYLLLNKPLAFSLDDYEQYKGSRGLIFENMLDYMPGHHLYDYDDLVQFIGDVSVGNDPYESKREAIQNTVLNPCDNYSGRVWSVINEYKN